jgi:hypothetical protein
MSMGNPFLDDDNSPVIPEPFRTTKSTRVASAPVRLFRNVEAIIMATPESSSHDDTSKPLSSLVRGEWCSLLDTAARLLASGIPASKIAEKMGLSSKDLTHRLAVFAVTWRDSAAVVEADIRTFFGTAPNSEHSMKPTNKITVDGTGEDKDLFGEVLGRWMAKHEEEETLLEDVVLTSLTESSNVGLDDHEGKAENKDFEETYHDARGFPAEPAWTPLVITQGNPSQAFGSFASNDFPRDASALADTSDDKQSLEPAKSRGFGQRMSPTKSVGWFFTATAVVVGRVAGVLLSEAQNELGLSMWNLPWSSLNSGSIPM